ncbi:hypothetical protein SETIT_9G032800v2 [Setaria italica]|uniref:Uncharacterized protein n=1 Tax=Setaria italica TaxID=4555 RepID=A0A368SCX5_SETIT|nr:hypothetical protein SETIT_9G032800v2 [Setaria italica]
MSIANLQCSYTAEERTSLIPKFLDNNAMPGSFSLCAGGRPALGAVADKAVSKFVGNLGKQTPVADKLQRLERLHMRVRSAVEVSEKYAIESTSLLRWREDLKEAAAHGGKVLLSFQQRDGNHQQASSSSAGTGTAMSFTRKALSSMSRRIGTAASVLFSSDEDVKKLDSAVEALEKASENIGDFITLFQASPKLKRMQKYNACAALAGAAELKRTLENGGGRALQQKASERAVDMDQTDASPAETADDREIEELTMLTGRLQKALVQIITAVEISEIQDMQGLEWLAQWTEVLRQARQQGVLLLKVVTAKARKETTGYDLDDDDIHSFVHIIESLAEDFECFMQLTCSGHLSNVLSNA